VGADEGHRLRKLVDLLLGAAGNVLDPPAPLVRFVLRLVGYYKAQ
jgi:hypothetical protein